MRSFRPCPPRVTAGYDRFPSRKGLCLGALEMPTVDQPALASFHPVNGCALGATLFGLCAVAEDRSEGTGAFLAKCKAAFHGR
jgi:hypothetical protein